MTFTFINQTLGIGGAETFTTDLINWLKEHRVSTKVFSTNLEAYPHASHIPIVIDLIGNWKGFLKGLILFPLAVCYYFYVVWSSRDTDVIFMTGYIEKIIVTPLAKLLHIPVVWLEFAPLTSVFSKFFHIPQLLYYLVKDLPHTIIVPSHNSFRFLPSTKAKIVVIPLARHLSQSLARQTTKHSQSVFCVSRFELGKGQDLLVQAWPEVITHFPAAQLYFIGDGDFRPVIQALVHKLNLTTSIHFLGYLSNPEVFRKLASADISIFPSVWPLEGFGLVAIEAMAAGLPVIGFATGPLPEIVTPDCGHLVPSGDTSTLASAIIKLLAHPSQGIKLGAAGRRRFLSTYTFTKVGPQYLKVFSDAL